MEIEKEETPRRGLGFGPVILFLILALLLLSNLGWHQETSSGKVQGKEIIRTDRLVYNIVAGSEGKKLVQEYMGQEVTVTGKVKKLGREKLIQVSSYSEGNSRTASG